MSDVQPKAEPQCIHEARDGDRQFLLHPGNDDLFVRTGKQVIEACRLGISIELWLEEFQAMLEAVAAWAAGRQQQIRSCYCSPGGVRVNLFFAPQSTSYDDTLAGELVDLNLDLVHRFNVGTVEVRQVPFDEFDRFIDPDKARLVHGRPFSTHSAVDA